MASPQTHRKDDKVESFSGSSGCETPSEHNLRTRLRILSKRNEALRNLYDQQKSKLEQTRLRIAETRQQINMEIKSNKSKEDKIELIRKYISSRKASVKKREQSKEHLLDDLREYIKRRVFQLTTDVFSIEEINLLEHSNSQVNMETSPLLTFSDGSNHQIEQQTAYSIVEPWLPGDGDYSLYSLWVNDNPDHIPASVSELSERNPAFRIGAGLAYTTQLVKNLASYLDVILPAKIELDTFSRAPLNDPQFSYNVAKLNTNIMHLCLTQGVNISLLQPQKTLKNLLLLLNLNLSDLGRRPIVEIDNEETAKMIEEKLNGDLCLVQDEFYEFSKFDDDEVSDSEWEISDSIIPTDMQLAYEQSTQQQSSYMSLLPRRLFASFWSTGN